MHNFKYILITPAHNEGVFIQNTIKSVIQQTVLPLKWIIVDDGSTDNTSEIVKPYLQKFSFIEYLSRERESHRTFASKVRAFNSGIEKLKHLDFDFIGNLDADVTFDIDYYERILTEFQKNSKLGIAGGDRYDFVNGKFEKVIRSSNSVSGAVQLFNIKCFSEINGYRELDYGGIDAVAESMARFAGWEVQTFRDIIFHHHRRTGTAKSGVVKAYFRNGVKEYLIGYHPVFEFFRVIKKLKTKPYFIVSIVWFGGYLWAGIFNFRRVVPKEFIKKLRKEQMHRLKSTILKTA
jgi:glycosyltransferase involved in cell wall biosynthesis